MSKAKQQEFLELYEPIHDRFERFCKARLCGNMEFQDLVNETLLVAFSKFETIRSKDAFWDFSLAQVFEYYQITIEKKREFFPFGGPGSCHHRQ